MTMNLFVELACCLILFVCHSGGAKISKYASGEHGREKRPCEQMRVCLEPFPMLVDLVENDNAGALATLSYKVVLDYICSQYEELGRCLSGKTCNNYEQTYTAYAVKSKLSYICGEGKAELPSYLGCYTQNDFQTGVAMCADMMYLDTRITTIAVVMGSARNNEFCTVFQVFLRCVHRKVKIVCSDSAADYISTVYAYGIRDMADALGCYVDL